MIEETKNNLNKLGLKPNRKLGQNFLIDIEAYDDVIKAAELNGEDRILEVGPGLGFLTEKLSLLAKSVTAVEFDKKLFSFCLEKFSHSKNQNVELLNEDILLFLDKKNILGKFKVVANLPYQISSFFLRKILGLYNPPSLIVLMLQKEVAERIAAKPPKMSILGISVQAHAGVELLRVVSRSSFWPEPEIESAIVKIKPYNRPFYHDFCSDKNGQDFFRLVKFGFASKRKMLKNNLSAGYKIEPLAAGEMLAADGLNANIRAQELSLNDWRAVYKRLKRKKLI